MSGLEFTAALVEHLAWPVAAILAVLLLRSQLTSMSAGALKRLKVGPGGVEAEWFEAQVEQAQELLEIVPTGAEGAPMARFSEFVEELLESAAASPRLAVIEAYMRVEAALRDRYSSSEAGKASAPDGPGSIVAAAAHILSSNQLRAFDKLRKLRNAAVHDLDFELSEALARSYVFTAEALYYIARGDLGPDFDVQAPGSAHE